jgi:succinate dehydrogenase / fumarate reductase membrane anchor subunit
VSWRSSSGLRSWLLQRLSAIYIALSFVGFTALLVMKSEPLTYEVWRAWVASPVINVALALFVLAMLVHAWVGIRDVLMDYVHSSLVRFILLISIGLGITGIALWALRILLLVKTA